MKDKSLFKLRSTIRGYMGLPRMRPTDPRHRRDSCVSSNSNKSSQTDDLLRKIQFGKVKSSQFSRKLSSMQDVSIGSSEFGSSMKAGESAFDESFRMPLKDETELLVPEPDEVEPKQIESDKGNLNDTTNEKQASLTPAANVHLTKQDFSEALSLSKRRQSTSDLCLISTSLMRPECEFNTEMLNRRNFKMKDVPNLIQRR